ncbi:unnamed protein product, partial [Mycena citricolor]
SPLRAKSQCASTFHWLVFTVPKVDEPIRQSLRHQTARSSKIIVKFQEVVFTKTLRLWRIQSILTDNHPASSSRSTSVRQLQFF